MTKPIAVLISDIHFNLKNLTLASQSLKSALIKAELLGVPLIVAGDLNDTKAIIRAEVANALISILSGSRTSVYIMVGNHDLINERGTEHGLNFLKPYAIIVDTPTQLDNNLTLLPYFSDNTQLKAALERIPPGRTLIMHQGFQGAEMGDYVLDKTSISTAEVKNYRVFSGHYHRHQTLETVTYIGNPYTMSFGESNDGPKGFLVLNQDNTYSREILLTRKHIKLKITYQEALDYDFSHVELSDLLWLVITGTKQELKKINKQKFGLECIGHTNFKLDLDPIEESAIINTTPALTDGEIFDHLIDNMQVEAEHKQNLKVLWKTLL